MALPARLEAMRTGSHNRELVPATPGQAAAVIPPYRRNGLRRLHAPVQRVIHTVVLEAFCNQPGQPRLDPRSIDSAGYVLRRVQGAHRLAWLSQGPRAFGWDVVPEEQDPAADRRRLDATLGHPALDARTPAARRLFSAGSARLAQASAPVSETVQPLFVAPPEACAGAGRTLLFGTLAFPADERSDEGVEPAVFGATEVERTQLREHLSPFLRASGSDLAVPGLGGTTVDAKALLADVEPGGLRTLVEQLHTELDAFDGQGAQAESLRRALAALKVVHAGSNVAVSAWEGLSAAKRLLFGALDTEARLVVPQRFVALSAGDAATLFNALIAQLGARWQTVVQAGSRYEADGRDIVYVLRAFVRLKPAHPGCAPQLLWSAYSEPFTLAAWHESAGVPVPVVPLPDLFDRNTLAALKPNVAFTVPAKLAGLLRADAKKLAKGEEVEALDLKVDWVCSFSIPIITICAFIVLNIFLQLLNIIFWWLPFLKICIPLPRPK
jgi:hypothetical protein